jgi:hypothetical protein
MERVFPHNVEELRFISCKMGSFTGSVICNQIAKGCFLRKLSLVQASLCNKDTNNLCDIIKKSELLIDLDLSWNELSSQSMLKLAETLSMNRTL